MTEPATAAVLDAPRNLDSELALVDLSSIAYPIFLMSAAEPDPNAASTKIVDRVRALTSQHKHAAICCDSGRSFRADIDPAYKAQREAAPAPLIHQIRLAQEQLAADGYPVWRVKGFEADDLIATATARALAMDGSVLIVSADKDLLQLVGPNVRVLRVLPNQENKTYDEAAVRDKFGVSPAQMGDYLALVGDAADNIIGAKGIGAKTAAKLLQQHGTLEAVFGAVPLLGVPGVSLSPSIANSLTEFKDRSETVRSLIALRSDVDLPFEEIAAERAPRNQAPMEDEDMEAEVIDLPKPTVEVGLSKDATPIVEAAKGGVTDPPGKAAPQSDAVSASRLNSQAQPETGLAPAPVEFERQLEPRSLGQAIVLANHMHTARMFNGYGSPQAVLSTVLAGRELGIQAIASLRAFHVIDGRHMLAADVMRALVLRSGLAKYFRAVERTPERATFETWRKDDPEPIALTFTLEEGRTAFGFEPEMPEKARVELEGKWRRSGWGKNPADMNVARAGAKLARLVYPEVTHGLYCREEIEGAA